ncbi:GH32 C-terminal domain-containing protein [Microbacterium sp.]|uniref:GH32 C-terminal domain-containing protein n=1 Tax=Microbacterium sp. TaxID=51671 RepID=UPI0039E6656C
MIPARPNLHFTPSHNWMNDPNGLVFHRGRYHLFFQHNPYGITHANMSWGHASSTDLVSWEEHPVAIACDDDEFIFSGSVVVDEAGTSGFGEPGESPMVAVYTTVAAATGIQAQALAYSTDEGMTWTKYSGNPVLDRGSRNFRDPKVFRYRGEHSEYWVMTVVEADEHEVLFYRSDDLRSWSYLSSFGPAGAVGGVWECPDLFPLALDGEVRWVLLLSLNPGGVAGGSGTQYFVGQFDGERFVPDAPVALAVTAVELSALGWVDHGRDCYAGVTFNGLDDDQRTLIAWMDNWDYARERPATRWRGAMTMARRLTLRRAQGRPQLCSEPILPVGQDVVHLRAQPSFPASVALPSTCRLDIRLSTSSTFRMALTSGADGDVAVVDYCARERTLTFARMVVGMDGDDAAGSFPSQSRVVLPGDEGSLDVLMVIDRASVEIFAAGGARVLTHLLPQEVDRMRFAADGDAWLDHLVVQDLCGTR